MSTELNSIIHTDSGRYAFFQTDVIDEEKHEHSRISKVNLVDLAGSERQSTAKTSGDRLRVRCQLMTHFVTSALRYYAGSPHRKEQVSTNPC